MSKPTAVQWLIKELKDLGYYTYNLEKLCEQAKQMEKEQMGDAYRRGFISDDIKLADDYYNETHGGEDERHK